MSPDVQASIKARLLNRANERGEQLELHLVRYASERLLYRLGASPMRDRYVLKGAGLLTLWMRDPYRATRDLDFLAFGPNDEASVRATMRAACGVSCPEDGMEFDLATLEVTPIRDEEEYHGQRAVLRAFLGKAMIRVQVDFAFGDAVVPGPEEAEFPTMLAGLPPPKLRAYPRVATIAEKFEAMVHLGRRNSRMKDYHDVWALSSEFAFEGPALRSAVVACFERRSTAWTPETPDALRLGYYRDPEIVARWNGYVASGAFRAEPPASFEVVGERLIAFLGPIRESIVGADEFESMWAPGGPWR